MKVKHLITELEKLMADGHGDDDIIMAQSYANGYVYQNIFSTVEYNGERCIGLVGRGIIDDRRQDS